MLLLFPATAFVRWTQWIFLQLFKKGLAYQAEVPVNWCPALGTVLANEEVIDGKSERGNHPVVRVAVLGCCCIGMCHTDKPKLRLPVPPKQGFIRPRFC